MLFRFKCPLSQMLALIVIRYIYIIVLVKVISKFIKILRLLLIKIDYDYVHKQI